MILNTTSRILLGVLKYSQNKFLASLEQPKIAQQIVFRRLINNLSNTEYGNH